MLAMAPHMSPTPVAEIARHRVGFSCGSKEAYGRVVLVYEARLLDVFAVAAEHLAEHIAPVAVNAGSFSGFLSTALDREHVPRLGCCNRTLTGRQVAPLGVSDAAARAKA